MKLSLLLIPLLLFMTSCSIDWNDEKDKKITELEKQVTELKSVNNQFNKEKQGLVIGSYFTPHAATRKIEFFMNGNFIFHEDEGLVQKGNYVLNGSKLILQYENGNNIKLKFYKGNDKDNNYYIEGNGEYFVKE